MKKFLAIDTSSAYMTVIACNQTPVLSFTENCAGNHSVLLLPRVEETMQKANLSLPDCDFFAVSVGAGSFTGIRIAIATVKGFCVGTGKKALPVTSFEMLAYTTGEVSCLAVISARHGYVYLCGFDENKNVTLSPSYKSLEEAREIAKGFDVVAMFEDLPLENAQRADMAQGFLTAVLEKSKKKENFVESEGLFALYVRKSQAEEGRKC